MNDFNAKILLVGEYGIIKGSMGLAFPLENFKGHLDFTENQANLSHKLRLDEFYNYLKGSTLISKNMNLAKLEHDIKNGLFFRSNIPHGYGIGSSGALCASLFAEYAYDFKRKDYYEPEELSYLKDMMSLMESFYHGTSSGIDCLISLINLPLLIESRSSVKIIENPLINIPGTFYLYDSGHSRVTSSFVHEFLEQYQSNTDYRDKINQFVELTNNLISKIREKEDFSAELYKLSRIQYLYMANMIPNELRNFWLEGLESKKYYLKLCGAGGGGYFILYTQDRVYQTKFENLEQVTRLEYGQGI